MTFLNEYSNVIQIGLSVLTLFATVVVSFLIYWLQKSHEKEVENAAIRQHKLSLSESAKVFLIDNHDEVDYLPLCVMAASVNRYAKHDRQIYTRFNRCSNELQNEILQQRNIPISVLKDGDWRHDYLKRLDDKSQELQLGKSLLYDGAKYFHRGIERYASKKIEFDDCIFEVPSLSSMDVFSRQKHSLTFYIDRYLELILKDRNDTRDKPEILPEIPPFDLLWENQGLSSCPEELICFWAMKAVSSTCIALFRHDIVGADQADWRNISAEGAKIETFEDLYYDALLVLYTAYETLLTNNK